MRPLITDRRTAALLAAVGLVLAVAFGVYIFRGRSTAFDTWVFQWGYRNFGGQYSRERSWWTWFSEPAVSLAVPVVVAVAAAVRRDARLLALAVIGPLASLGLTELVGKPVVARVIGPGVLHGSDVLAVTGSYPSGHETGTVSWLSLLVLVVWRLPLRQAARWTVTALAGVWALCAALGLTINYYHYATDTLGAIASTVAVMLAAALAIDTVADRGRASGLSSPAGRDRSSTSRAV